VLRVRRSDPRFTLRGPRASALTPMHSATIASGNNRVLAGCPFSRFRVAPLARPVGAEPRATARVYQRFMII